MEYILTAQAAAMDPALREAGNPPVLRTLEPGVILCGGIGRLSHPVFLRHICPAAVSVPLSGGMEDLDALRSGLSSLVFPESSDPGAPFSVQTRIITGYQPAYKRFDVNTSLSQAVQEMTGLPLDVKSPVYVLSVTLDKGMGWLGFSRAEDNLSAWAGGARRYKWEEGQISRAEFKLLEALETFGIAPQDGERALDLGAAPGGWTRILRRRGLYVVAVDPAALDPRLARDKRVTHYRGTAQAYFKSSHEVFDLMVNDMKMDSGLSAQLMLDGAACLAPGGTAILTLKLPDDASDWPPRLEHARSLLSQGYNVRAARQLFHNRSEVTLHLEKKA